MAYLGILALLVFAFIVSRINRSTKMWWTFVFTILLGLLIGIMSKQMTNSNEEEYATLSFDTVDNSYNTIDMQSLVATVTEGTTVANLGLQVISSVSKELPDASLEKYLLKERDSPEIKDSS